MSSNKFESWIVYINWAITKTCYVRAISILETLVYFVVILEVFQISWFTTKLSRYFKTEIALFGVDFRDFRFNFIHWQLLSMAQTRQTLRPSKHGHNLKFCLEEAPKCWKDFLSVKTKLYSLHGSPLFYGFISKISKENYFELFDNFLA